QMIMLVIILGLNFYVLFRLWNMVPPVVVARPVFVGLATLVVGSFLLFFVADSIFPVWLTLITFKIGTSWFFIMVYLLILFLLGDILRLCGIKQVNELLFSNWKSLMALTGLLGILFTAGYINCNHKERTEIRLNTSRWSTVKTHVRIVAVSDLHLGYGIGPDEFSRWIEKINVEKPDIVLIAGDLIDNSVKSLYHYNMAEMFNRIHTRYGIFMVPGNHEYYTGMKESLEFLSKTGITLLRDSAALTPAGIYIVGRDDKTNENRKSLGEIVAGLDPDYPVILLDHQPYHLEEAQENNIFLQFSGHTHRGQVWPISWITDKIYEISYGYGQKGDTHYYISSGLGIWGGKFRIGTRSEYVVIDINP
ncbi:MAG: metallophosphoesterase, partial [Bacteroides sp.]|nr:metallophosphoesterase [Bacteroides sp.]